MLKLLNSNTENPLLIWDNGTRAELTEFLATEQQNKIRTVSYYIYDVYTDNSY